MKNHAIAIEKILSDADALIRRRMKALGVEAPHLILAVAPDGAGIIRSNVGPDGLGEISAMLKDIAEQAAAPTESDTKH
jgi:hypothetical protein